MIKNENDNNNNNTNEGNVWNYILLTQALKLAFYVCEKLK